MSLTPNLVKLNIETCAKLYTSDHIDSFGRKRFSSPSLLISNPNLREKLHCLKNAKGREFGVWENSSNHEAKSWGLCYSLFETCHQESADSIESGSGSASSEIECKPSSRWDSPYLHSFSLSYVPECSQVREDVELLCNSNSSSSNCCLTVEDGEADMAAYNAYGCSVSTLQVSEMTSKEHLMTEDNLLKEWVVAMFSATIQSTPPPRQKQESEQRDNYYVNVGNAIRTLREELPSMFYKDVTYDIFRDDIVFRDPMNTFYGMKNYQLIFWALRFHGQIFFKALWVDVVRIWQPSDRVIMVRWSVRGLPRVPWEAQGHFDGTSEYKLDKDGKIYEHKVDNVVMNSGRRNFAPLTVMDLLRLAGARTTPTPTFFKRVALYFETVMPYLSAFTWVRFYWALMGTLTLTDVFALP